MELSGDRMQHFTEKQSVQEDAYSFPYHYLDLAVKEYRLIHRVLAASRIEIVRKMLRPFQGQLILDAGCGDGRFCYELKNENAKVIGVDISERALAFAKAFNPEVEFYNQDLRDLSLPYKFDSVVMMESLEHIIPDEIPAVLLNLSKVLRERGRLVVTVPSVAQPVEAKHYQHFSEESLKRTLDGYFKIIQCTGHIKEVHLNGYRIKLFWVLRRLSELFYSCLTNIRLGYRFYEYINKYFDAHVAIGKPDKCMTIIAVCEKI
jgi:SAM-dependent methyltransferase